MSDYNGNGHKASNGTGVTALNGSSSSHGSSSAHQSREGMELVASQAKPRPTPLDLKPTGANRAGVANAFERYGQVMQSSVAPLPNQHGADTFSRSKKWGKLRDDVKQLRLADYKTLLGVVKAKVKGEKIKDDKTMAMEKVIQLVSNLPSNSKTRTELTNSFLSELWYTLEHPPSMYVGEKFQYRQADGSYNNVMFPQLGAAGTSYSRSVAANVVRQGALPDPNLIFESVMKRTEYTEHPNNVSSILWYWASIIIHDLFWTDYRDMSKSKTSSYLDLSPLYGSNQDMQDTIRTFKDGKIKPDCFADKRLLGMPPGVGVFLIMFNRVHNHVAENLARINEDGRFSPPSPNLEGEKKEAAWKKYDNDLFQHARLITSGLYINITLLDYVRNIVNLNRVDTTWTLDPRVETGINVDTKEGAERGTGNVCSAEFNLCYRWHSCISAKDDKWIQDFYYDLFKKPGKDLSIHELIMGFGKFEGMIPDDPAERPFNKFQRGPDGKFNDDDLVNCISDAIEDPAGSFGARNVPESMRAVEILGIIQGRRWNVAGLNEFRKHFGLKPYEKFEDINSDPGVAESLRRLYDHPDFVELYPGLVAEERKEPMVPGVGIAPTYTISRVVLSDAVCLVRGDRHYTIDYTPRNLTNWGFNEVQYDLNINHGCVFYKLFLRAFPNHFKYNSVYAHYPMVTPSENSKILKDLKRAHLFDFSRPGRIATPTEVTSYDGAQRIFAAEDKFKSTWNAGVAGIRAKASPELSGDAAVHDRHRTTASRSLFTPELGTQIKAFYESLTDKLLTTKSYTLVPGSKFADLVRDIANIVPTHFAASVFGLPLTTKENRKGIYTEHELYAVLQIIASALFVDSEPVKLFPVVEAAKTVAGQLGTLVDKTVKSPKAAKNSVLNTFGVNFIKELKKAGLATHDITWNHVLPTAAALASSQGELFTQAVDYYLSPEGAAHVADITAIASQPSSSQNDALLLGYVLEGIRLSGSARSHFEATTAGTVTASNGTELQIQPGSKVTINSSTASRDAAYFPEPETVNPRRPLDKYIHFDAGPHAFLGKEISQIALTEMFRALFKRKNVRRAPGPQGELKKVPRADGNGVDYLREDWGALTPFPVTMKVMWDEV